MILRLLPLVRASYKRNRIRSAVFFLFMLFCVILILLTVSVILPMWSNMETKINNHPYNVELTAIIADGDEKTPERIKSVDHVVNVLYSPPMINAADVDNLLGGDASIQYLHNGYMPEITAGRAIREGEKNAAVIVQTIKTLDPKTQRSVEIDCKRLVGRTVKLLDMEGNKYAIKIVGTYSSTDPALYGNSLYTTYPQMLEYDKRITHDKGRSDYSVIVDHASNRDAVERDCGEFADIFFINNFKIDVGNFNMALTVLLCVLAAFLIMVVIGTSVFVSSCISGRTSELALYRSIGYKFSHIFTVIFCEYLFYLVVSTAAAVIIAFASAELIINPYLDSLLGDSIMAMRAQIGAANILAVFLTLLIIIFIVCINAARRTGKIELSVLLKEK